MWQQDTVDLPMPPPVLYKEKVSSCSDQIETGHWLRTGATGPLNLGCLSAPSKEPREGRDSGQPTFLLIKKRIMDCMPPGLHPPSNLYRIPNANPSHPPRHSPLQEAVLHPTAYAISPDAIKTLFEACR